jgi:Leucine-rich repeat (LRR) protein
LKKLYLGFNQLENLDQCNFTALKLCCPDLSELYLHCNKFKFIPPDTFKALTALRELGLDSNSLKCFDMKDLPFSLQKIWLSNNLINSLDFSQLHQTCPDLQLFDLSFNRVQDIQAEFWPSQLVNFYISGNGIKEIDLSRMPPTLRIFDVGGSDVTVSGNFNTDRDLCESSTSQSFTNFIEELKDLDSVRAWLHLEILDVSHNQIERFEEKHIPQSCIALFAAHNKLKVFNSKRLDCPGLQILDLSNNEHINKFDSSCLPPGLRILNLYNNSLKHFDTSSLPDLKTLWLGKNQLTEFSTHDLPTTLKILSLTSNQLQRLDFERLPRGLEVLNVNNNFITEIDVPNLPKYLQQLEFKNNQISQFEWREVADNLKCLMSIKFEKNSCLTLVDESKVLRMFHCIMESPNLSLKSSEFVSYLQKFSENCSPDSVVGTDAWLKHGLPVPSEETVRKNWNAVCKYMIAVGRSGGARGRCCYSAVYISQSTTHKFNIVKALSDSPRVCIEDSIVVEFLKFLPHELNSRSLMLNQRICVLTLEIEDTDDFDQEPRYDLKPAFRCLHSLYHSMARLSVIVVLCNSKAPGEPFLSKHIDEVRDVISMALKSEIERIDELSNKEVKRSTQEEDSSLSVLQPPASSPLKPSLSILENAVGACKRKIEKLSALVQKTAKLCKIPVEPAAAEAFWEGVCCKSEYACIRQEAEKLWALSRKHKQLASRLAFLSQTARVATPSDSRDPTHRRTLESSAKIDLLHLGGVVFDSDHEEFMQLLQIEICRREEVVPNFFELVRSSILSFKRKNMFEKPVYSRAEITKLLKDVDVHRHNFARGIRYGDGFRMEEIPEPDLWGALQYCSSLGECLVLSNTFIPDAAFVRVQLAEVFKKKCTKDAELTHALHHFFDLPQSPRTPNATPYSAFKHLAKLMWNTLPMGLFTKECAASLKCWKLINIDGIQGRDCLQFFEDIGVIVPFFFYEGASSSLQFKNTISL